MTNVFRSQSEALPWYLTTRQTTGIPSPETIRRENRTRSQKTRPRPTTTTETTHRYSRTLGQVGLLSKRTNRKIFGDDAQKAKSVPASRFSWWATFRGNARVQIGNELGFGIDIVVSAALEPLEIYLQLYLNKQFPFSGSPAAAGASESRQDDGRGARQRQHIGQ